MTEKIHVTDTVSWYPKDQTLLEFIDDLASKAQEVAPHMAYADIKIEFLGHDYSDASGDLEIELSYRRIETDQEFAERKTKERTHKLHNDSVIRKRDIAELQRLITKYGKG